MTLLPGLEDQTGATFDEARFYRYRLWRVWDASKPKLLWLMLNPSTADETVLDPTIRRCVTYTKRWGFGRRCVTYTKRWGFGGLEVANLFAMRATDPVEIKMFNGDPVGPENDRAILAALDECRNMVVCAWGTNGKHAGRDRVVIDLLRSERARLLCLGTNGDGTPKHPLYLKASLELESF